MFSTKKGGIIYTCGHQRRFIARYKYYEEESVKAKGGEEKNTGNVKREGQMCRGDWEMGSSDSGCREKLRMISFKSRGRGNWE
jgi:hypothetical protein